VLIKIISIRFHDIRIDEKIESVQVQVLADDRYLDLVLPVSEEMRAKPFQIDNVAGEFLFDLIAEIKDYINPPLVQE